MATTKKTAAEKTEKVKKAPVVKAAKSPKAVAPKKVAEEAAEPVQAATPVVAHKSEKAAAASATLKGEFFYAAGNRKTSVARVRLYEKGTGTFIINDQTLEQYIVVPSKRDSVKAPLRITGHLKTFDISIHSEGGGLNGQADAMRHGISKALLLFDPSLRITLKRAGFLTRDPRMKERKKYGLHRARRAPQWSKR